MASIDLKNVRKVYPGNVTAIHALDLSIEDGELVVLVGQSKAIAIAVKNESGRRRWSKLDEWLQAAEDVILRSA